jgi:hypothetical protein
MEEVFHKNPKLVIEIGKGFSTFYASLFDKAKGLLYF